VSLAAELRARLTGRTVVVGIGNPLRGDDAAGSLVARSLAARWDGPVIDAEEVPERMLGAVAKERPAVVLLVDSVDMAAEPGALALLRHDDLSDYWPSTHRVPVALLMEYLNASTGAEPLLLAIQLEQVDLFRPVSSAVSESVSIVVDEILAALVDEQLCAKGRKTPVATERCQC
jgi:hydrogenase maturation protease HycI